MTRAEATKRFCGECRKHVHDLGSMTESEARALLATAGDLCVRYVADERGRLVFLPDVPSGMLSPRRRAAMAASLMAASMSLTACMGARRNEPPQSPEASNAAPPRLEMTKAGTWMAEPRRYEITKGETRLSITDEPGVLVDTNAAPPLPGQAPPQHPFLSGACGGGDALGCARARELLDQSSSTDEFVSKLSADGFVVVEGR